MDKEAAFELTPDKARGLWTLALLSTAGVGLGGGLLHPLLESKAQEAAETPTRDFDVDILDPAEIRRIRSRIQQELRARKAKESSFKKAQSGESEGEDKSEGKVPAYAWLPILASMGTLGLGGGHYLGSRMSDSLANRQINKELNRAKKRFRDALLREQLAAVESGQQPYAPFMPKSSGFKQAQDEEGWWEQLKDVLGTAVLTIPATSAAGGLILSPLAFRMSRDYMKEKSEDWRKWQKARKELEERLMKELPYAQLSRQLPRGVREQIEQHLRKTESE